MRVKDLVLQELNYQINLESEKRGVDNTLVLYCIVDVVKVDPIDKPNTISYKKVYRSINKLPIPVRLKHNAPLYYVGSADRMLPYKHVTNYAIAIRLKDVALVGDVPKYTIRDGYLEVYINDANLKKLSVGHIWHETYSISNETSLNAETLQDEESELLIPIDMLQRIKERIIKTELGLTLTDDNVIKVSDNEELDKQT
jgi:hypothetical protein